MKNESLARGARIYSHWSIKLLLKQLPWKKKYIYIHKMIQIILYTKTFFFDYDKENSNVKE